MRGKEKSAIGLLLNILYGTAFAVIVFIAINIFSYSNTNFIEPASNGDEDNSNGYAVFAMRTPDSISFAGERVPTENFDVRESLDMEIHKVSYWHSEMFLYLKRANRYFPVIEPILRQHGVPEDFKYLCVTESGLTNAISPAKAVGFWQFMKTTGKHYGLEVNDEVDERYNLEKATHAACKYLKSKKRKYGSWALAAASYNAGDGGVNKFIDYQKVNSYYDLALYKETGRYMYRMIAMKLIMENPVKFGFNYKKSDLYPVIDTKIVKVDSTITDIAAFAKKHGTNYKILKELNPWLRAHKLTNRSKKNYNIIIPEKGARSKDYFPHQKEPQKNDKTDLNKKDTSEKKEDVKVILKDDSGKEIEQ